MPEIEYNITLKGTITLAQLTLWATPILISVSHLLT